MPTGIFVECFLRQYHDREKQEVREGLKRKEARVLAFLHQLAAH